MHRDRRLRGLSSDHHHALVFARTIRRALGSGDSPDGVGERLRAQFARELEPHFRIEEQVLLPALAARQEHALVERTLADHARLRELAASDDASSLIDFATHLERHVRFEEREMFPACERELEPATLEEVERLSPPPGKDPS